MGERFIEKLGGERFGCARKEGRGRERERGERAQEEERRFEEENMGKKD